MHLLIIALNAGKFFSEIKEWIRKLKDKWMNEWMNDLRKGWINEWMNKALMNKWMIEWILFTLFIIGGDMGNSCWLIFQLLPLSCFCCCICCCCCCCWPMSCMCPGEGEESGLEVRELTSLIWISCLMIGVVEGQQPEVEVIG